MSCQSAGRPLKLYRIPTRRLLVLLAALLLTSPKSGHPALLVLMGIYVPTQAAGRAGERPGDGGADAAAAAVAVRRAGGAGAGRRVRAAAGAGAGPPCSTPGSDTRRRLALRQMVPLWRSSRVRSHVNTHV